MEIQTLVEFDEAAYNDILNRLGKVTDFKVVEGGNEKGSGIDVFTNQMAKKNTLE